MRSKIGLTVLVFGAALIGSGCGEDLFGPAPPPPPNQPPSGYLTADPAELLSNGTSTIRLTIEEYDGDAVTTSWTVPSGCELQGAGNVRQASFAHPGFFYVSVTMTDKDGNFTAGTTISVAQRQPPAVAWSNDHILTYGHAIADIIPIASGGYAAVGLGDTPGRGFVTMMDNGRNPLWLAYGPSRTSFAAIAQAFDGRLVVAGTVTDSHAVWNCDVYLACYNSSGNCESVRTYGGDHWDESLAMAPLNDSLFAVLALMQDTNSVSGTCVLRVTGQGDTLSRTRVADLPIYEDLAVMTNGDAVAAVVQEHYPERSLVLTRLHPNGSQVWTRSFPGYEETSSLAVAAAPDGGVFVASGTELLRTDANGNMMWHRSCFFRSGYGYTIFGDLLVDERGCVLVGFDDHTLNDRNGTFVVRTDFEGLLVWYYAMNNFEGASKVLRESSGALTILHGRNSMTGFAVE